jgi:tight adherence protein B
MIFWIPPITFLLVSGLGLLIVSIWQRHYSAQAKAKTKRLGDIEGYRTGQSHTGDQDQQDSFDALDKWLREHVSLYVQLGELVTRAHSRKTPLQILGLCGGTGAGVFLLGAILGSNTLLALVLAGGGSSLPVLYLRRTAQNRRTQFENKLPEALDFLARALRAGHSITVSMGMAGNELADPIGTEFKTVFDEIGFGIPFNESMASMAKRINSADLDFLVIALLIQRETGGNLTELLEGLAKTVRDRIKLQGKVRTLSAEGRFSAVLLGSLPFVLGSILSLINPGYMEPMWSTPQGHSVVITGTVLLVVGFLVLNKIAKVKV